LAGIHSQLALIRENNEFLYFWPALYSSVMSNPIHRIPENVPGRFYVDDSCIDCDLCRENAPEIFRRESNGGGYSVVYRQPVTPEEIASAEEAMNGCPMESIGNDGVADN
jgi:ferredoxin